MMPLSCRVNALVMGDTEVIPGGTFFLREPTPCKTSTPVVICQPDRNSPRRSRMIRLQPFSPLCIVAMCWTTAGCGGGGSSAPEPPVKLYPVKGKVAYKDDASVERLERGKVWFQSKSDPALTAVSSLGDDGTFAMTTLFPENKGTFAGVPAGQYKVRVEPPIDDDRQFQWKLLAPKFADFNHSGLSVTVPTEGGEITFEVERPRR
jgi:hypothetical protein